MQVRKDLHYLFDRAEKTIGPDRKAFLKAIKRRVAQISAGTVYPEKAGS